MYQKFTNIFENNFETREIIDIIDTPKRKTSYCVIIITADYKVPILIRKNSFNYTTLRKAIKNKRPRIDYIKRLFDELVQNEKELLLNEFGNKLYEILGTNKLEYVDYRLNHAINNNGIYEDEYDYLKAYINNDEYNKIVIRKRIPYNIHMLPGGGKRRDESIEDALYREVKEEFGVVDDFIKNKYHICTDKMIKVFDKVSGSYYYDNIYIWCLEITGDELVKKFKINDEAIDVYLLTLYNINMNYITNDDIIYIIKTVQKSIVSLSVNHIKNKFNT